jgi:hypothetical protein
MRHAGKILVIAAGLVFVVIWRTIASNPPLPPEGPKEPASPPTYPSLGDAERRKFVVGLDSLKAAGAYEWLEADDNGTARVGVGPAFYELSFEEKAELAQLIGALVSSGKPHEYVFFLDYRDHRDVGSWDPETGLNLKGRATGP